MSTAARAWWCGLGVVLTLFVWHLDSLEHGRTCGRPAASIIAAP